MKTFNQFINEKFETSKKLQMQILWTGSIGINNGSPEFQKEANDYLYDNYIHLVCLEDRLEDPNKYETKKDIPENRKE